MNNLLRIVVGGVRLGLWSSVLVVVHGVVSYGLFGDGFRWRPTLSAAALMLVLFGVGGLIYGLLLQGFARDGTHPSTRARLLAGMAAGALASGLFTSLYLLGEPQAGHMSHAGFMLMFTAMGKSVGAVSGVFCYSPAGHRTPSA